MPLRNGKSDTFDAEAAARSVLAGTSAIVPKTGDGVGETIRQVKIARDTARKGRTTAIITRKAMIVNAPAELRESLAAMPDKALLDRCGGFRPAPVEDTTASTKHALRALAKRWVDLDIEITGHDRLRDIFTAHAAPTLRDGYGIGADTAAEMLIVFRRQPPPHPLRSRLRQLCGACPIPHSQG